MNTDYISLDTHEDFQKAEMIEVNSINLTNDSIIVSDELKFTYFDLLKWFVKPYEIVLVFDNLDVKIYSSDEEICNIVKNLSKKIVSKMFELEKVETFEEGLDVYLDLISQLTIPKHDLSRGYEI